MGKLFIPDPQHCLAQFFWIRPLTRSKLEAEVAAIVGSLDASQLAEEGKQLTAFRLFLLTRRRGQQQQTEAGFPLLFLIGAGFPRRFFLQFKIFNRVLLRKVCFNMLPFQFTYLLVTWRVESISPCRRVEDSSVWGSSVWPARTVVHQLVSGTGPCTRVQQLCSGTKLDITEKAVHDIILGLQIIFWLYNWVSQF